MKETLRNKEIFEIYYLMGSNRSLQKLCDKLHQDNTNDMPKSPSLPTLKAWSGAFNWQERIELRDINNGKELEKKVDKAIVNSKAGYRAEIKTQWNVFKASLNEAIKDIKDKKVIKPTTIKDLRDITRSFNDIVRLDLLLMGENPDENPVRININKISIDKLKDIRDIIEND